MVCAYFNSSAQTPFASYWYMLRANHGSGQSVDCLAHTLNPCFAQQSQVQQTKGEGHNRGTGL